VRSFYESLGVAPCFSFCSAFAMLICRYLSKQLRQNIVLLGQQVVAICIARRDAFVLNSDACLFRLAWILTVFEMLMAAKLVSEVITRISVSRLLGSGTNLADQVAVQGCCYHSNEELLHWDPYICAAHDRI